MFSQPCSGPVLLLIGSPQFSQLGPTGLLGGALAGSENVGKPLVFERFVVHGVGANTGLFWTWRRVSSFPLRPRIRTAFCCSTTRTSGPCTWSCFVFTQVPRLWKVRSPRYQSQSFARKSPYFRFFYLQDRHVFAPIQSQNLQMSVLLRKSVKFSDFA